MLQSLICTNLHQQIGDLLAIPGFKTMFERLGATIVWPPGPADNFDNPDRRFVDWTDMGKFMYKGEVDRNGNRCGQGLTVFPGKQLRIGNYKNGQLHGSYNILDQHGSRVVAMAVDGKTDGYMFKTYFDDRPQETMEFSNGEFLGKR